MMYIPVVVGGDKGLLMILELKVLVDNKNKPWTRLSFFFISQFIKLFKYWRGWGLKKSQKKNCVLIEWLLSFFYSQTMNFHSISMCKERRRCWMSIEFLVWNCDSPPRSRYVNTFVRQTRLVYDLNGANMEYFVVENRRYRLKNFQMKFLNYILVQDPVLLCNLEKQAQTCEEKAEICTSAHNSDLQVFDF